MKETAIFCTKALQFCKSRILLDKKGGQVDGTHWNWYRILWAAIAYQQELMALSRHTRIPPQDNLRIPLPRIRHVIDTERGLSFEEALTWLCNVKTSRFQSTDLADYDLQGVETPLDCVWIARTTLVLLGFGPDGSTAFFENMKSPWRQERVWTDYAPWTHFETIAERISKIVTGEQDVRARDEKWYIPFDNQLKTVGETKKHQSQPFAVLFARAGVYSEPDYDCPLDRCTEFVLVAAQVLRQHLQDMSKSEQASHDHENATAAMNSPALQIFVDEIATEHKESNAEECVAAWLDTCVKGAPFDPPG
ncbi:hypothetical protein OIV83_005115 [Microbotryomycetes sp. JL201]|nr:hypothetical protein OIV83_005115 [Microbotryomycetes sp. JL201]